MRNRQRNKGFSLTEVLLAVGTLAVGMIFISGTFLTGIHLTTVSTERTIAAVVADEAFAKIRLYGVDLTDPNLASNQLARFDALAPMATSELTDPNLASNQLARFDALAPMATSEFAYPSTNTQTNKQYYWAALCRLDATDPTNRLVQVTVFISRRVGVATTYPGGASRPVPVPVGVSLVAGAGNESKLAITNPAEQTFINGGSTIVDNQTGQIYRVLQHDPEAPDTVVLDKNWQGTAANSAWVVPPPIGGGKYPCIAVYQKLISF
jgi:Tfp pilus assembly protein PilV